MKTIAWIMKYIVLPLSPLILGATARGVQTGIISFDLISPTELGFSMAMLSLMVSVNASRLTNPSLKQALSNAFQLGMIVFLVLFAWSVYVETDITNTLHQSYEVLKEKAKLGALVSKDEINYSIQKNEEILSRLRSIVVVLALIVIPLTVYSNKKYNLEDL